MEISETQTDFETLLGESLFSAQESRASQQVWPGSEKAKQMSVGSGQQLSRLLSSSDPLGAFSKILMASLAWTNSEEFCYVWNRLDTKFELSGFQLTPLGQSTEETESLLWRTPNASDVTGGPMDGEKRLANGHHLNLVEQAATPKLWPTPQAHDAAKGNPERVGRFGTKHGGRNLVDEVMVSKLWPTPTAGNHHENQTPEEWMASNERLRQRRKDLGNRPDKSGHGYGLTIAMAAKLWPTPQATDPKGTRDAVKYHPGSGSLNPRFVEQLMGFPIDHTALKHSGIQSCRSKPTRSSKRSRKPKGGE